MKVKGVINYNKEKVKFPLICVIYKIWHNKKGLIFVFLI